MFNKNGSSLKSSKEERVSNSEETFKIQNCSNNSYNSDSDESIKHRKKFLQKTPCLCCKNKLNKCSPKMRCKCCELSSNYKRMKKDDMNASSSDDLLVYDDSNNEDGDSNDLMSTECRCAEIIQNKLKKLESTKLSLEQNRMNFIREKYLQYLQDIESHLKNLESSNSECCQQIGKLLEKLLENKQDIEIISKKFLKEMKDLMIEENIKERSEDGFIECLCNIECNIENDEELNNTEEEVCECQKYFKPKRLRRKSQKKRVLKRLHKRLVELQNNLAYYNKLIAKQCN